MYWSIGACAVGVLEMICLIKNDIKEVSRDKMGALLICMSLSWITFILILVYKYAKKLVR